MTTRERIQAGKYDYSSPKIQCVADAVRFAHIFEFKNTGQFARDERIVAILAFDSIEAEEILKSTKPQL